jgi:hypothetical protein
MALMRRPRHAKSPRNFCSRGLADHRRVGINDERTRPAIGLGFSPHALQFEETLIEAEILVRRQASLAISGLFPAYLSLAP